MLLQLIAPLIGPLQDDQRALRAFLASRRGKVSDRGFYIPSPVPNVPIEGNINMAQIASWRCKEDVLLNRIL